MSCIICLENIYNNQVSLGLMESCDHIFHKHCIKEWREICDYSDGCPKACPLCKKVSLNVVYSKYKLVGEDRIKYVKDTLETLKKKPCRDFNRGYGVCMSKNQCLYGHIDEDGREFIYIENVEKDEEVA